jgi:flavin reductase (DIM6/NTAB) family NADH-FMN oxidoreductase RutF
VLGADQGKSLRSSGRNSALRWFFLERLERAWTAIERHGGRGMKQIDWDQALTLLSPHSYALLSTVTNAGRTNLMGVGWWTITSWNPPMVAVSIGKPRYTARCLDQVPEFGLCFPGVDQAKGAWVCGTVSGAKVDKFKESGLEPEPSTVIRPPLVKDAAVAFECRVVKKMEVGDHILYVGEIVAIHGTPGIRMHLYTIHYRKLAGIDADLNVEREVE